ASVGTIEAAFRALVKQHHPDVSSGDESRMTRLNLAREWLTDPEPRGRYDRAPRRGRQIPAARRSLESHSVVTRSYADRRASGGRPTGEGPTAAPGERRAQPACEI